MVGTGNKLGDSREDIEALFDELKFTGRNFKNWAVILFFVRKVTLPNGVFLWFNNSRYSVVAASLICHVSM